jgi:hypothetical protein
MRLVLVYDTTAGASVLLNGNMAGIDTAAAGTPIGTITEFIIGAVYSFGPSPALTLQMDNVVLRGM